MSESREGLNRFAYEQALWKAQMNPKALVVALAYGSHGDGQTAKPIWVGVRKIGEMVGLNKDTVSKYRKALLEQGWLIDTGNRHKDGEPLLLLGAGKEVGEGYLAPARYRVSEESKANLHRGQAGVSEESETPDLHEAEQVSEESEGTCPKNREQVSEESGGTSSETSDRTTMNIHIEQPREQTEEASQAQPPFASNKEEARESKNSSLLSLKERCDNFLFEKYGPGTGLDREELDRVRALTSTAVWGKKTLQEALEAVFAERSASWDTW